jgi:hypothetical protein
MTGFVGAVATPAVAVGNSPTVTIEQAPGQTDPASTGPIVFIVVFSEPVEGLIHSGVSFTGTTTGGAPFANISGSGTTYTVSVTGMGGPGDVVASIKANAAWDVDGNMNVASTSTDNSVAWDPALPTVTINQAAAQSDPTSTTPIVFDVVFSEPVTSFDGFDISFAGSTAGGALFARITGSGTTYTVEVVDMAGDGTVVVSIPAGRAFDSDGLGNLASASTDNEVGWILGPAPTVTINQHPAQADPATTTPIVFDVDFSEPVTGFFDLSVDYTGSTADNGVVFGVVSGSGAHYTVSVVGLSTAGTVVATIPAGAAHDADGQANAPSTSLDNVVLFDPGPSVTINQGAEQADPTATSPIVFDVVFSEPVTGFTAADVNLAASTAGGPLTAVVAGSGAVYTVTVSGMTGGGAVVATIAAGAAQDADGHGNAPSTSADNTVTWQHVPPGKSCKKAGPPPWGNDMKQCPR